MIVDLRTLGVEETAETKRMRGESPVGRIGLDAVSEVAAEDPSRGAIKNQIAGEIWPERHRRIAAETRDLVVEIRPNGALKSQHAEVVLFELVLVDGGRRIDRNPGEREDLGLIGIRRDLEVIHRRTRDQAETRRGV